MKNGHKEKVPPVVPAYGDFIEANEKDWQTDEMVRALLDASPLYVEIWEHHEGSFKMTDCNKRALNVFGVSSKEKILDDLFVYAPKFQPCGTASVVKTSMALSKALKEGHVQFNYVLLNTAGEEMLFEFSFVRLPLPDKNIIVGYGYDLRQEREEERLRQAEIAIENIKIMIDAAPISMALYDSDYVTIDCNSVAPALLGCSDKMEFIEKDNSDFVGFSVAYQPCGTPAEIKARQLFAKAAAEGRAQYEWMNLTKDGRELLFDVTLVRVDLLGSYVFVSYAQDLRPIREAEQQRLAAEFATLEREKKFKENILATISHELRTPLAVMSVYAEMTAQQIRSGKVTEQALSALDTISEEARRLAGLASNTLDMFVKRAAEDTKAPVDISKMVLQLANILSSVVKKRNIVIETELPENLPLVWGIAGELTQVLWNIFDNAIRHTEGGTVRVIGTESANHVTISIADTGEGMTAEAKAHAFEHGYTSGEGAGLGLVFCKEIIEAHGGIIHIESESDEGCTVTFTLPINRDTGVNNPTANSHTSPPRSQPKTASTKKPSHKEDIVNIDVMGVILLVEDNKKILEANRWILEQRGHTVLCAETLDEARAVLANESPDVAVLDIMLPDGDGLTFIEELRTSHNIPVLFLSSMGKKGEILKGLRAGSNDYITKPYTIDEFCARVESTLQWELAKRGELPKKIVKGPFTLDLLSNQALLNNQVLSLTHTEFKLLYLCLQNEGQIMDFGYIYENIWGQSMRDDKNAVQSAVKRFRKKIEPAGYDIYVIRGKGYVFEEA